MTDAQARLKACQFMKLSALNPRWVGLARSFDKTIRMGLSFDCPHCGAQRLTAHFRQPIDPHGLLAKTDWQPGHGTVPQWDRTGDTFESLTLSPSLDFAGHWHGHIINGEVQ
jgi:hypothetical protein